MATVADSIMLIVILLRVLKGRIVERLLDSFVIALSAMRVLTAYSTGRAIELAK